MENKKNKFHGLSSPDELIDMWRELRYDDDDQDINVIWDYTSPKQLESGFNVVNIKYDPKEPRAIGHYVLITKDDDNKEIEYFNPVSNHTKDDEDKLNELLKYSEEIDYVSNVDLSGKQTETSENCGFHCLTHAYNLYKKKHKEKNEEGGASSTQKQTGDQDKMDTLIKAVRGIYFGLKYGFDKQTPQKKASGLQECGRDYPRHYFKNFKASGLADYGKDEYTYTGLKDEIEN